MIALSSPRIALRVKVRRNLDELVESLEAEASLIYTANPSSLRISTVSRQKARPETVLPVEVGRAAIIITVAATITSIATITTIGAPVRGTAA